MGKINVLDKSVSELIAAGEVIERPASIVKELLENSIDAGASALTVEIKNGGISFIRVSDNGSGLEKEDVPTAFLRHATSKVLLQPDLEHISTLGFRGEALASISAVAKVELITKTQTQQLGTRIVMQGGEQILLDDAGCPQGTTVIVRDLFYNVPARLKFLKKDFTEGNAVQGIVEKLALSHPEVSFRMIKDNKTVLHTAGDGKLMSAVYAVLGREFAVSLLEVDYTYQAVHVSGLITKPSFTRSNRSLQHFFVNDRYVKSRTCLAALEEGYKNSIMVSKFPACVLKISLDYSLVDVNVHPAKTEVRFVNEKPVFEAIYFGVKTALSQEDHLKVLENPTPVSAKILPVSEETTGQQTQWKKPDEARFLHMNASEFQKAVSSPAKVHAPTAPFNEAAKKKKTDMNLQTAIKKEQVSPQPHEHDQFQFLDSSSFAPKEASSSVKAAETVSDMMIQRDDRTEDPDQIRMIGELFKTYILCEADDLFIILDKHAAHERILFENLKTHLHLKESQILLTPFLLKISLEERSVIEENLSVFESFGFRFVFQDSQVYLTEAPLVLHQYALSDIVEDMVKNLASCRVDVTPVQFEELLHSIACRAAIKANHDSSPEELLQLAKEVYRNRQIRYCPHGRPVGITMSKYEVEKKFGRH